MNRFHFLWLFTLLVITSGCATTSKPHQQPQWQLSGKIGVRSPEQASSGFFSIIDNSQTLTLSVNGPLGMGSTTIIQDKHGVTIKQRGKIRQFDSLEALDRSTSFQIPIAHFRHWLYGNASPHAQVTQATQLSENKKQFSQDGWRLTFSGFAPQCAPHVPKKITAQSGDHKITLLIKKCQVPLPPSH